MTKLIKNWEELALVPANDKYRIVVAREMCSGWIIPIWDEPGDGDEDFICYCRELGHDRDYYDKHVYLSTHTFYGSQHEYYTKVLQEHGFDIELDNWDK
jgi:hypothetical protein